ncbi:MAG: poly-beta-1,6-N-acetyl-D-glucosamine biosynthesis protein PgaD [Gammaproteobacteria bacterium]
MMNGINDTDTLIIERADLQSRSQRIGYMIATLVFWGFWLNLWTPFVSTTLAWAVNTNLTQQSEPAMPPLFLPMLGHLLVVAAIAAVFGLWVAYNFLRFRGKERRKATQQLSLEQAAEFFKVESTKLNHWQNSDVLTIHHDQDGNVVAVAEGDGQHAR